MPTFTSVTEEKPSQGIKSNTLVMPELLPCTTHQTKAPSSNKIHAKQQEKLKVKLRFRVLPHEGVVIAKDSTDARPSADHV